MTLQEKIRIIENDISTIEKGIDRVRDKYPLPITLLVKGNKTGVSVCVDENFDKVTEKLFIQKRQGQN